MLIKSPTELLSTKDVEFALMLGVSFWLVLFLGPKRASTNASNLRLRNSLKSTLAGAAVPEPAGVAGTNATAAGVTCWAMTTGGFDGLEVGASPVGMDALPTAVEGDDEFA